MHPRLFRLIEIQQHIDESLHQAQQRADGLEITRLRRLKAKARQLISRFVATPRSPAYGRA